VSALDWQTRTTPEPDQAEAHPRAATYQRLLSYMAAGDDFVQGLASHGQELVDYVDAGGAALYFGGRCTLLGATPSPEQVEALVGWLSHRPVATTVTQELVHTDALADLYPEAAAFTDSAAGLLAVSISRVHRSYVLWFRPAIRGRRSAPWPPEDVHAAGELRQAIVGIALKEAEEAAELSGALQRANRELEAFSYSISHDCAPRSATSPALRSCSRSGRSRWMRRRGGTSTRSPTPPATPGCWSTACCRSRRSAGRRSTRRAWTWLPW
jgi:light-regulated signal transduction histidine kinase (bacteriophytochrome)